MVEFILSVQVQKCSEETSYDLVKFCKNTIFVAKCLKAKKVFLSFSCLERPNDNVPAYARR